LIKKDVSQKVQELFKREKNKTVPAGKGILEFQELSLALKEAARRINKL
jgi:hypothetical protein